MIKLIPGIAEGSWVIKQSVGNTPVLLGGQQPGALLAGAFLWPSLHAVQSSALLPMQAPSSPLATTASTATSSARWT